MSNTRKDRERSYAAMKAAKKGAVTKAAKKAAIYGLANAWIARKAAETISEMSYTTARIYASNERAARVEEAGL